MHTAFAASAPYQDSMPPATSSAPSVDQQRLEMIAAARKQARRIMRAAAMATFSGWTCAVFACITLLCGIFSLSSLLLGIGFTVVAVIELRGAKAIRRFDLTAPKRLALNQMALCGLIMVYAGWRIFEALTAPGMYDEIIRQGPEMAPTLEPLARLQTAVTVGFYIAVIVITLAAQLGMAIYYLTRRTHMISYLRSTPSWAVSALRAAA